MILDLDIGNSRIKWRLTTSATGTYIDAGVALRLADITDPRINHETVKRVRVSCVRRQQMTAEILSWCRQCCGCEPELAQVVRKKAGLEIFYQDIGRLGVDRWLAMLAIRQKAPGAFMVVDCGTAMTIDLVDNHGAHLGGYIVPGTLLCRNALVENTAIRVGETPDEIVLAPGHSTDTAVYHGILAMLIGLIEKTGQSMAGLKVIYLTGGDTELFGRLLARSAFEVCPVDGLVLDGLAIALP